MGRYCFFFCTLILFCLAGCRSNDAIITESRPQEDVPELKMENLKVQSWGLGGLEWEMTAPIGEGFTQKNIFQVSTMTVQLFEGGEPSSRIKADRGIMATGDRPLPGQNADPIEPLPGIELLPGDMYLDGGVVVVSTEGNKLTTDWMKYYVEEDVIRSSAPVKVERPDSVTEGTGLEATADLSRLQIFKQTLTIKGKEEEK